MSSTDAKLNDSDSESVHGSYIDNYNSFIWYEVGKFRYNNKLHVFGASYERKLTILDFPVKVNENGYAIPVYPHEDIKRELARVFRDELMELVHALRSTLYTGGRIAKLNELLAQAIEDDLLQKY